MPPTNVEVAVEVAVREPVVRNPIDEVALTRPALNWIKVEVALARSPPHVVGVQEKVPEPPVGQVVLQPSLPRQSQPVEMPVEERRGRVEVAVVVAVKFAPTTSPATESIAYGEVVPMPTLPLAK